MPESARLRVFGQGEVEVELVTAYLTDFRHAYNSVLVFESTISGMQRAAREFPFARYPYELMLGWPLTAPRAVRYVRDWPPTTEQIASLVPRAEQLVLSAVNLTSPGFWDFFGTLNPLEVLRHYLNDRHERRKDRDYRESAEQ